MDRYVAVDGRRIEVEHSHECDTVCKSVPCDRITVNVRVKYDKCVFTLLRSAEAAWGMGCNVT